MAVRVPYGRTTLQSPAELFSQFFRLRPAPWQLASAAAACLLLHTVMNVCLQPKQPAPVPGGLAGVATLLASGTTGLASFPWTSLLADMTVSGSAATSHRCASRLPCCDATSAPAAGSQPPWEGLGRAPCDMLHHELASCSSQAHRLRVHTDSLQQQQANCAAELRQAKATAAAAAFMRLWASLASAACVVLAVQLRAKSQKGAGEGDTQLPDEQQATGGSSAPGACLTLQAVQSSQIEPGAVGGPGTRPPLRAGTRAGQQQQQRLIVASATPGRMLMAASCDDAEAQGVGPQIYTCNGTHWVNTNSDVTMSCPAALGHGVHNVTEGVPTYTFACGQMQGNTTNQIMFHDPNGTAADLPWYRREAINPSGCLEYTMFVTRSNVQGGQPPTPTCSNKGDMTDEFYSATFTFYEC
ncbi:hypothetical protein N2152v2_004548 [Parachlorella kessleri]